MVVSVRSVMANVSSATHTFVLQLSFESVMNVITDLIREGVSSAEDLEYLMLITVKSVRFKRRIGMDARRL